MNKPRYFITATGTGIGKTFITAALARQAVALGRSVAVYKPIISGFDAAHPESSDAGVLLNAVGKNITLETLDEISPWRFSAPLAPSMASRIAGREIEFDELIRHGKSALQKADDAILFEGVGGVMAPLNDSLTTLDWMEALAIPVVLVTGSYLGAISHTLTASTALRGRGLAIRAVIVNESEDSSVELADMAGELARFLSPITPIPLPPSQVMGGEGLSSRNPGSELTKRQSGGSPSPSVACNGGRRVGVRGDCAIPIFAVARGENPPRLQTLFDY